MKLSGLLRCTLKPLLSLVFDNILLALRAHKVLETLGEMVLVFGVLRAEDAGGLDERGHVGSGVFCDA